MNRYAISIPKPCHENWGAMTPDEKGRFCAACQKTVVDFTAMNTAEVDSFFDSNAGSKVCGRFNTDQLSAPVTLQIPRESLFMQRSFRNIFLLALVVCMGTTLFSCKRVMGEPALVGDVVVVDSTAIDTSGAKVPDKPVHNRPVRTSVNGEVAPEVMGMPIAQSPAHLTGDTVVMPASGKTIKAHR